LYVFGSESCLKCLVDVCACMRMDCLWFDMDFWICMREQVRNWVFSPKRATIA